MQELTTPRHGNNLSNKWQNAEALEKDIITFPRNIKESTYIKQFGDEVINLTEEWTLSETYGRGERRGRRILDRQQLASQS